MTSQTSHYIELSDLVELRLACKKCGTALLVRIGQGFDYKKLHDCPACGAVFMKDANGSTLEREIGDFLNALSELKKQLSPESKFKSELELSLEVNGIA